MKKLYVVGDSNVGKSAFIERYVYNRFNEHLKNPIQAPMLTNKTFSKNRKNSDESIFVTDIPGCYRSDEPNPSLYNSDMESPETIVLLVFDLTNPKSFKHILDWMEYFKLQRSDSAQCILLGTKADCVARSKTRVTRDNIDAFCESQNNMSYYEVSSKSKLGIEELSVDLKQRFFLPQAPKSLMDVSGELESTLDEKPELAALIGYHLKRDASKASYYHWYGRFFGFSRDTKLKAVNALINAMDGTGEKLSDKKLLKALSQGELGQIVKDQHIDLDEYTSKNRSCF